MHITQNHYQNHLDIFLFTIAIKITIPEKEDPRIAGYLSSSLFSLSTIVY